jgi:hypothetical protein
VGVVDTISKIWKSDGAEDTSVPWPYYLSTSEGLLFSADQLELVTFVKGDRVVCIKNVQTSFSGGDECVGLHGVVEGVFTNGVLTVYFDGDKDPRTFYPSELELETFKIGDRVEVTHNPAGSDDYVAGFLGKQGTITKKGLSFDWHVLLDGSTDGERAFNSNELTLLPPLKAETFTVYRRGDISANHDENQMQPPDQPQYFGVVFPSGKTVINWNTVIKSVSVFDSFDDLMKIHGHLDDEEYQTEVVWDD